MTDAPGPATPQPAVPDVPRTRPRKRFLPAFGRTAFVLGGGSLPLSCLFGALVRSMQGPLESALATSVFAITASVVVLTCAILGVVFGVLSLFGLGKADGTSRPILGAIGALTGSLMSSLLVIALLAAANARSRIEAEEAAWPFTDSAAGIVLDRPGPNWILRVGQRARAAHPNAIAAAIDPSLGESRFKILFVMVESLEGLDVASVDMQAFGESVANGSLLKNKQIESVQPTEIDGYSAVKFVVSGTDGHGKHVRQFFCSTIRGEQAVGLTLTGSASDATLNEAAFDDIIEKLELRSTSSPEPAKPRPPFETKGTK